jgi:hypothetical protein
VRGDDIRLGRGAADVRAAFDGRRYVTRTDTSATPIQALRIGHTLPRGASVGSVMLDGRPAEYTTRETNRGLEVVVAAEPSASHTLVVTAG